MVKITSNLKEGIGWGIFRSGLKRIYDRFRDGDEFQKDIRTRALKTESTLRGFEKKSIGDILKDYNLEHEADNYLQNNVFKGFRYQCNNVLDVITNVKDSLEDIIEGAELGAATAGLATGGAGTVGVEIGSNLVEVPFYAVAQTIYAGLTGLLGYSSGIYKPSWKGCKDYSADTLKGYAGAFGNAIPVLGSALQLTTNFDDKRPRIAQNVSEKLEYWLSIKLKERGVSLPQSTYKKDLVDTLKEQFKEGKYKQYLPSKAMGRLVDYKTTIPLYDGDVNDPAYNTDSYETIQPRRQTNYKSAA